jgi:hypothetical protein
MREASIRLENRKQIEKYYLSSHSRRRHLLGSVNFGNTPIYPPIPRSTIDHRCEAERKGIGKGVEHLNS